MCSDLSAHTEQRDYPDIEIRHFPLVGYMLQVVPESGILGVMLSIIISCPLTTVP